MKYVLISGQFSTTNGEFKPTLLGIIDPTNYKNTISLLDILTDTRIAKTVYNLGLRLTATGYLIQGTTQFMGVTPTIRENINTNAFTEVKIPVDVWDMDELSEENLSIMRKALIGVCDDFADSTVLNSVIQKLASDGNKVLFTQYDVTTNGTESPQYYMQEGILAGDNIKNITILQPRAVSEQVMHNPMDEIPFRVPSFYDLVCYNKFKQAELERELREAGSYNAEDEENLAEEDNVEMTTSYFSCGDMKYTDLYLPYHSYAARTTAITETGNEIPVINTMSIRVQSVTEFWEVYPASQIPEGAFGKREDGRRYKLSDLTGSPENNHLTLQQNERRYYNDLVDLLKVAISIEHNALSEEMYQTVSDKYSETVEEYLKTLSEEAFNLMWCHTGTTQAVYPAGAEPDDVSEEDEPTSDITTVIDLPCRYGKIVTDGRSYVFQPFYQNMGPDSDHAIRNELKTKLPRLYLGFDGNAEGGSVHYDGALVGYVQQNPSNRRWIDTLIRLLRWGNRKPSMLSWERLDGTESSVNTNKYWNLNTASVSSHDGNIDNHVPVLNEKIGNPYELVAVVCADVIVPKGAYENIYGPSNFEGGTINVRVPIGVKLQSTYESGNMYKITYEDIFTYHDKIKSGNATDARGHIKFVDGEYTAVEGMSTIVPEEYLKDSCSLIEATNISQRDNDTEFLFVFSVSSNAEIAEKRKQILSNFTDANAAVAFKDQASTKNIFNSMHVFTLIASQASCLTVGKRFSETLTVGNFANSLGVNAENARIVYTFLNRLIALGYNSVMMGSKSACDLKLILNRLDNINTAEDTAVASDVDPCWADFEEKVGKNIDQYAFCEFNTPMGIAPVSFGISRDKANPLFVFLTREELKTLQDKYGPKVFVRAVAYEQKYKNAFSMAVRGWNAQGKNLTECSCSNMRISSNAAMETINKFLV